MHEKPATESPGTSPAEIDRRRLIGSLVGLFALPAWRTAAARSLDAFLAEANPLAEGLIADQSPAGQDRYLRALATLAADLSDVPLPDHFNDSGQGVTPGSYRIGFNPGGGPFRILHWRLAPGAMCRAHAHTYGNVVSIGLEGIARVRNYEVRGRPDYSSSDTFEVKNTVDQVLGPGDFNLVSLERNYIHEFTAGPDGARGLDITTPLKPRPDIGTPYLQFLDDPDSDPSRIAARWSFD